MVEKVFLFDFDGVIADSLEISIDAFEQCIEKYNLKPLSGQEIDSLFKNNIYNSALGIGIPSETLRFIYKDMKSILCENSDKIGLFSGMKGALKEISEKSDVCIISSNIKEMILNVLDNYNIGFIKDVLGGEDGFSKVKKIKKITKKYPGAEFYFITDTMGDIKKAKRAKVNTVAVTWGLHTKEELERENPDFIVEKPYELLFLVKDIPYFIKIRGCINCDASKERKQKTGKEYGFDHVLMFQCMAGNCSQYPVDLQGPYLDPEDLVKLAKKDGRPEVIEGAKERLLHIRDVFGIYYRRMGVSLDEILKRLEE